MGGRYYTCRPPTVHTIAVFLRLFGLQAAALCKASGQGVEFSREDIIEHLVSDDSRASVVAVLETCVTCDAATLWDAAHEDVKLLRALAEAVVSLTDPARIVTATGLDRALDDQIEAAPQDETPADHDADAVCYVAAHFGLSPTAVMDWPYLAFLAAGEHLNRLASARQDQRPDNNRSTVVPGLPMDGILYERGA